MTCRLPSAECRVGRSSSEDWVAPKLISSLSGNLVSLMLRIVQNLLRRASPEIPAPSNSSFSSSRNFSLQTTFSNHLHLQPWSWWRRHFSASAASSPSLSIWRRKKEMSKEGLMVAKELKRLRSDSFRLDRFIRSHVSRLLKSDLVSVLVELQRQNQVFLSMKVRRFLVLCFDCNFRIRIFWFETILGELLALSVVMKSTSLNMLEKSKGIEVYGELLTFTLFAMWESGKIYYFLERRLNKSFKFCILCCA